MNDTTRRAAVAVLAAAAMAAAAMPAHAGTNYLSRTTGRVGLTDWVQVLDLRSRGFGNVHLGFLSAYETATGVADVFAWIDDFDCPEGQLPGGGGHGDPGGCTFVGSRTMEGSGVAFTVDGKLNTARLQGTLTASRAGHEGPGDPLGTVTANFTWTGYGDIVKTTSVFRYRENGVSYSDTYRSSRRAATMSGVLGPMLFEEAAQAAGSIEQFREKSQSRS